MIFDVIDRPLRQVARLQRPGGMVDPQGDRGPEGPRGPRFSDGSTSVAAIGLGVGLGILGSIVIIRARKPGHAAANSR